MKQVRRRTHLSCPTCKKEVAFIDMFNGYMEIHDVVIVCATCEETLHEKDMIISSYQNFRQDGRFSKTNPYKDTDPGAPPESC